MPKFSNVSVVAFFMVMTAAFLLEGCKKTSSNVKSEGSLAGTYNINFDGEKGESMCVDIEGSKYQDGTSVVGWHCMGSENQRWTLSDSPLDAGYYEISAYLNGVKVCLSNGSASLENSASYQIARCDESDLQKFLIDVIADPTAVTTSSTSGGQTTSSTTQGTIGTRYRINNKLSMKALTAFGLGEPLHQTQRDVTVVTTTSTSGSVITGSSKGIQTSGSGGTGGTLFRFTGLSPM